MKSVTNKMASQSTAKFVSYDLRPSKQCERKMMLDSFNTAMESGFPIPKYRYVGMGANRFYDFILMHKYLGIDKMISLEHDEKMLPRAKYNRPYKFIKILNTTAHNFFASDNFAGNSIYWMDYDSSIRPEITQDIASLVPSVKLGDFVFFTVCGSLPKRFQSTGGSDRLTELKDTFRDMGNSLTMKDVENAEFPVAVHKILKAAFTNAFVVKSEGVFRPFFQVQYADGLDMITYGGVFAADPECRKFIDLLKIKVPFLNPKMPSSYRIKKFDLTEKERNLFDLAVTAKRSNAKEIGELKKLGFRTKELRSYSELLRYHPRYVETFV